MSKYYMNALEIIKFRVGWVFYLKYHAFDMRKC